MVAVTSFQGIPLVQREIRTYHASILQASVCFIFLKQQCIRVLKRNSTNALCVSLYVSVDWLELIHEIMEAGRTDLHSGPAGWRPRGKHVAACIWYLPTAEFSLAQGKSVFCSGQAFYWWKKAHPHYGRQPVLLKIHQFKMLISSNNILKETSRMMFDWTMA